MERVAGYSGARRPESGIPGLGVGRIVGAVKLAISPELLTVTGQNDDVAIGLPLERLEVIIIGPGLPAGYSLHEDAVREIAVTGLLHEPLFELRPAVRLRFSKPVPAVCVIAWGNIRLVATSVAKTRLAKDSARKGRCPVNNPSST